MAPMTTTAQKHTSVEVIKGYVALTKPRIIELLLVTTIPTMVVAANGIPGIWLMVTTLIGGTLAAGGANTFNMVYDRDIDAIMERTKKRPLVTGVMTPRAATIFACVLELLSFALLAWRVNFLSAWLAMGATAFYVFIYTIWLKRRSKQNIVIGGAAGAVPVLIGWAAVQNNVTWTPILLFVIIFIWTPPHFWALAVRYRDDYAAANVPMMPVVASLRRTTLEILVYSVLCGRSQCWLVPPHILDGSTHFLPRCSVECSPSTRLNCSCMLVKTKLTLMKPCVFSTSQSPTSRVSL